jgi:hypothetical protein
MGTGNTTGRVVGQPAAPQIPAAQANPAVEPETPKEKSLWERASPWVHGGLGLISFIPGASVVSGGLDSAIYAAEGNYVEAGLSAATMIPGGKIATTVGKGVKAASGMVKGAHAAEEAAKLAKIAREAEEAAKAARLAKEAKLAKEAEEAARLKKLEEQAAAAKKAEDGAKVKPKKKLKCGEYGKYGELKKKNGDGKFDRDHIPSKAALKERALELNGGVPLTAAQKSAIDKWGGSIAVPRQAHIDVSPTHGTKNIDLAPKDAQNLAGAARRDVEEMLKKIDDYDADGGCKKAYQKSAKRVLKMNNKEFDDALSGILSKVK